MHASLEQRETWRWVKWNSSHPKWEFALPQAIQDADFCLFVQNRFEEI